MSAVRVKVEVERVPASAAEALRELSEDQLSALRQDAAEGAVERARSAAAVEVGDLPDRGRCV